MLMQAETEWFVSTGCTSSSARQAAWASTRSPSSFWTQRFRHSHSPLGDAGSRESAYQIARALRRQHDAKARLAAHHAIVSFGRALQRINLGHGGHARKQAELQGVLRIDGGS